MFIAWRGWGPLAALMLVLPLFSCVGLIDHSPMLAYFLSGSLLIPGGVLCLYFGRKWNQGIGLHTFYFIPLEYWGYFYLIVGGLLTMLVGFGFARLWMIKFIVLED